MLPDASTGGRAGQAELTPVRRRGLVDEVVQKLDEGIREGVFPPGAKLPPEHQLQAQLGVGRTTVREAVKVLVHVGMLEVRQGDGTYVRATTSGSRELVERLRRAHSKDVLAVRRGLDLEMVRMAALARTDDDLTKIGAVIERMRRILSSPGLGSNEFAEADTELRIAMAASTHNPVLVDLTSSFAIALTRVSGQLAALPGAMDACVTRYERVFDAVRDRDIRQAQEATTEYLDWVTSKLSEVEGGSEAD
ncbi:FadR/GntR family transcriptional regulator [Nocardia sp. NPDC004573]